VSSVSEHKGFILQGVVIRHETHDQHHTAGLGERNLSWNQWVRVSETGWVGRELLGNHLVVHKSNREGRLVYQGAGKVVERVGKKVLENLLAVGDLPQYRATTRKIELGKVREQKVCGTGGWM
jgi:hypothetical protein